MNLADKIREERNVLASKKAIKRAEDIAVAKEVNEQLNDINAIEFAEWFLTEVNIGSDHYPRFAYTELLSIKAVDFRVRYLHVLENNREKTKISSLIYASHHAHGYIAKDTQYTGDSFQYCLGNIATDKILVGLEDMGIKITTDTKQGMAANDRPYEVKVMNI